MLDDEPASRRSILGTAHINGEQIVVPPCAHMEEVKYRAAKENKSCRHFDTTKNALL
jgi:hypothetical protein